MVVAIMAVLAVVGFGFASSMKLEFAATRAIRNLSQARMAARAALQVFVGALAQDASAEATSAAGPLADHTEEDLFTAGASQMLMNWGNLEVRTVQISLRDEASKMNLNAFGNISKWDYSATLSDTGPLPGGDPAAQLYHGVNERFSSFEISFEEFFYHQRTTLWGGVTDEVARIRAANMARAICLYRYGGKKDGGDADTDPDYAGDGKPGIAGVDDDHDHDIGNNGIDDDGDGTTDAADPDEFGFGLRFDEIDNDGDGDVDEAYEGYDEPDEFNPIDPDGDGDTTTTTGPKDDRKFIKIDELKDAISHPYAISGNNPGGTPYLVSVPAAVNYLGDPSPDQAALDGFDAEAKRIFSLVKGDLTIYSYSLDIRSVSIDDPGHDGYDNDRDGKIDQADTTGATTAAGIKTQLDDGKSIYEVDISEKDISKAAQAAYIYWKLSREVTYTKSDGSTVTQPLVRGFTVQNAADIVDYRDRDCVPTKIAAGSLGGDEPSSDTYGFEGLHITEVGRYVMDGSAIAGDGAGWSGTGTVSIAVDDDTTADDRESVLTLGGLADGAYLLKLSVDVLPGGGTIRFEDSTGSVTKDATAAGEFWFGPMISGGTGTVTVTASATSGTYTVSGFHVFLPYIEIMNMSRRKRNMTQFSVRIGTDTPVSISYADIVDPATWANGEDLDKKYIARHKKVGAFDTTDGHGPYYGYFLIAYDAASFTNNFTDGTVDFPICVLPDLFASGFEGKQNVKLLDATGTLVAGGELDGFTDTGIGACKPISATTLSASRLICSGNLSYATERGGADYLIRPEASPTPGRWNRNDGQFSEGAGAYPDLFWPPTDAAFQANGKPDLVVLSDAGYYRSPGEVTAVPSPRVWATTLSFCPDLNMNTGSRQPLYKELTAFVVAARAPARLNLNTAGEALLQAAMVGSQPDFATLVDARPFTNAENAGLKDFIAALFLEGADSDGDNIIDEYSEREEWHKRHANVFTLRSHCFNATVAGEIKMPGGGPGGTVIARYALSAVYDRGRKLGSDGRPATVILTIKPESND